MLEGHLTIPERPLGVVLFAHGSGSSRHSPRNRYVASVLHQARVGTLLFDLLTPTEELDRANVFDIDLLARRLLERDAMGADTTRGDRAADRLLRGEHRRRSCPVGGRGARRRRRCGRVARRTARSRRGEAQKVAAPTLLIVGSRDDSVLALNRSAQARMGCETA